VRTGFGGGGGWLRYSMTAQALTTINRTMIVARMMRARLGGVLLSSPRTNGYSESVSMRSASAKSESVSPPLLCVVRIRRTLL
jgi:hypothetical protein